MQHEAPAAAGGSDDLAALEARLLALEGGSDDGDGDDEVPEAVLSESVEDLEARLAKQVEFDASKQRALEELLAANDELRKQNAAIETENRRLQHTLDLDSRRHKEVMKEAQFSDMYDWIVDIQQLADVSRQGWRVEFAGDFVHALGPTARERIGLAERGGIKSRAPWRDDAGHASSDGLGKPQAVGWSGAVVAVLGLYDKGKTFILNQITQSKLPSGKKVATKGLSFKHVEMDGGSSFILLDSEGSCNRHVTAMKPPGGSSFILLDSEGSYSPVKVTDELSVVEKEASELFLQELIFEMSDYFLCVVNDFTSLDQRYLDKLTRNLQNSKKIFKEVIVVHNCKTVMEESVLEHMISP